MYLMEATNKVSLSKIAKAGKIICLQFQNSSDFRFCRALFSFETVVCARCGHECVVNLVGGIPCGVISRVGKWHPTDEANSVLSIASYLGRAGQGSAEAKRPPRNPGELTDPHTIHKTPVLDRFAQNIHCA